LVLIIGIVIASTGEREEFRPDTKTLKIADNHPCPVCGKQEYTWGVVSSPQAARFRVKMYAPIWSGTPGPPERKTQTIEPLNYQPQHH
jgi:hypothetical protein